MQVSIYLSPHDQVPKTDYSPTGFSNITIYYMQILFKLCFTFFLTLATEEFLRYLSEVKSFGLPSNPANYTDQNSVSTSSGAKAASVLKL